ncbi:LysR family transcriptional regulator [Pseudomonas syringae pv. actinidiae ICMP 19071]|nr:LysR substrate-binding domain-containing protein [Pseudomonas syringae]EPM43063.1 LysR family transcriptional regulator [Pseudomonas syringae pv. actinidiae ICMP 19073]EPM62433.1 LysR family transcriptional regulator [Pseudomonas syringae pv. actinidiae ICMP 19071]EPM76740.1 LysR family transcriptional regulator [Pseudomonas syringae pv. actinidiae ICMP 19072]OSN62367.1 hypothetical protein BV349_04795 [Pseudomonas syringae pv. actinidiae]OSN73186.1 hypothetical protein BV351_04502 [Pseudom
MLTLKVGSEVFSAGSLVRPGGYSEFKVVDAAVLMSMALESKGVAWLPKSLEQQVQEGRLVRALDESWDISLEIHLTRPKAILSQSAEEFWGAGWLWSGFGVIRELVGVSGGDLL